MSARIHLLAAVLILVAASSAQAQVRNWATPGTGDWFLPFNWDTGVPAAGESAFIDNGGTAQIISASTPLLQSVGAGVNSAAFSGFIEIVDGDLSASSAIYIGNIGTGHLEQTGASTLSCQTLCAGCNGSASDGTIIINGGTVTASSAFYMANIGTAYVEQNGASVITAQTLCVGCNGGAADGTFVQNGGTANSTSAMYVGHVGTGLVTQNGGTINAPTVILAGQPSGDATWEMYGGELNVSGILHVGNMGAGQFTQHASSTVDAGTGVRIAWGSFGAYALEGGTLTAGYVQRGASATGSFTMNGGRLSVNAFGTAVTAFPLTVDGGTVAPNDLLPGTLDVYGGYTQGGAATFEIQLNGTSTASFDRLVVEGGVFLNSGTLDVSLGFVPVDGDSFQIITNDGTGLVSGTFAGLPEGAIFTVGGQPFQITYVGGNGNDVVLTAIDVSCVEPPPDMVAWWPLDEIAGTTSEDLINGNDGTHVGGPTPAPNEYVQNALCFGGTSAQYVEVPNAPEIDIGTTDFSIDAWVKTSEATGVRVIVEKRESVVSPPGVVGYSMFLANGRLAVQLADGDGSNACSCAASTACTNYVSGSGGFVADGQWHHVAVTVERPVAAGGTFYIDGAPIGTFNPLCRPGSYANNSPLRIGRVTVFSGNNFEGCIDEVELFNRELTASEVEGIYLAGHLGKCKCTCPADVNGDGAVNGLDVDAFTRCLLLVPTAGDHCACGDLTGDNIVDTDDLSLFVLALLAGGPC